VVCTNVGGCAELLAAPPGEQQQHSFTLKLHV
jgi:hypothetical protein